MRSKITLYGTTLVETLVATACFLVFSVAIYQLYARVIELAGTTRVRAVATSLAAEQFEFIRNLDYYNVGTSGGIPSGSIPQSQVVNRNNIDFEMLTTIRNIDHPADGTLGGVDNDLSPADNKLVEIVVSCTSCKNPVAVSYTSLVAPKALETENGNGAIVIRAIDANGAPVSGATVVIENDTLLPPVAITDTTSADGTLTIVDAPPAAESYEISVSKNSYSTETTYASGAPGNPNPLKPHLTVSQNQVSQATFAIDRLSTFNIRTQNLLCAPVANINGSFTGTKLIGTAPDVLKHVYQFTSDGSGSATLSTVEWDTYTAAVSSAGYDLIGINPLQPITVPPASTQDVTFLLRPANPNTLLVSVVDAATALPLSDVTVEVSGPGVDETNVTNVGSITQTDWSGGSGQEDYSDERMFSSADAGMEISLSPGALSLVEIAGNYVASATLTSSTFDLGAPTTFHQLSWFPTTQPAGAGAAPVGFQLASNNDNATWNFVGPSGEESYYQNPLSDIADTHNGHRYLRYKIFLATEDDSVTPTLTDVSFTYASSCLPPGQTDFSALPDGQYTITVSKTGYATDVRTVTISSNESISFSLVPS